MLASSRVLRQRSPYLVLGLAETDDASLLEIKKAFRKKAAALHPDAGGDEEKFKELCGAFETLRKRHGTARSDAPSATGKSAPTSGRPFYEDPYRHWYANATCGRQKRDPFDHDTYTAAHGEGLGEDFSRDSGWDSSRRQWRNYSTQHFYRPYQSDFSDPFGHGFTPEEIKAAEDENRRLWRRAALKYSCLVGGLLCVAVSYRLQDRINQANRARDQGYTDPSYWAAVDAARKKHRLLRQGDLWWEKPLEPLWGSGSAQDDEEKSKVPNSARNAARQSAKMSTAPLRTVSFRGRPFTPNGVRNPNVKLPMNTAAFLSDISFEPEDVDIEEL